MPFIPRHSSTIQLTGAMFNHIIGKFSNPDSRGHQQLEAHCTCGYGIKLTRWNSETNSQHYRRFQFRVQKHLEQVLDNEEEDGVQLSTE